MRKNVLKKRITKVMFAAVLSLVMVTTVALESAYAFTGTSPFIGNTYNHNARFTNYVVANGVDVSWWQHHNSNWDAAKAAGVDYAIIRSTYTSTSNTKNPSMSADSRFATHYAKAKAAGVMVGVYHFSQARTAAEAEKEAQFTVNRLKALGIGPKDLDLPVYFDYEFNSRLKSKHLNKTIGTAATNAFCNVIRANGYQPGVYASLTFINKYINVNSLPADVDIWCAQYNSSCGLGYRYSKWQYTSSGKIDGLLGSTGLLKGSIDCNFWYLDPNSNLSPGVTVSGGGGNYKYNGTPIKPEITVKNGKKTLKEGTDYKLSYINNVRPGTAYAFIRGMGSYSGYKLVSFTIGGDAVSVPATKIRYIKGKKKSFYIKVAKKSKSKVSGYQVKYSRNSDMSESDVKTIGSKYNKTAKTIKTNARKRYYYVQVRSYKKSGAVKYYSNWSKVKKVKVK